MKKNIIKTIFALSITAISLVSCVSDNDYEIPEFTVPFYTLNFDDQPAGTGVVANVPNTINKNLTSTPLWEIREYSGNKYLQFSSFNNPANTTDNTWFVLPEVELESTQKLGVSFSLAQAFPTGTFPLTVYYSTDFDGNSDHIETAVWTPVSFVFPAATANYVFVKIKNIAYVNESTATQKVYFAFNYKGAKTNGATTTVQLDNIKLTLN